MCMWLGNWSFGVSVTSEMLAFCWLDGRGLSLLLNVISHIKISFWFYNEDQSMRYYIEISSST